MYALCVVIGSGALSVEICKNLQKQEAESVGYNFTHTVVNPRIEVGPRIPAGLEYKQGSRIAYYVPAPKGGGIKR